MMAITTKEITEELEATCYHMSLNGASIGAIAKELGVTERTVYRALSRARRSIRETRAGKQEQRDLSLYRQRKLQVVDEAWRRVDLLDADSRTAAELLATISTTLDGIGKAEGIFVERSESTTTVNIVTEIEALLDRPIPVHIVTNPSE
jgi:transposase